MFRGNYFENVVSDVLKNGLSVHKNKKKLKKQVSMKTFTIFGGFWGQN